MSNIIVRPDGAIQPHQDRTRNRIIARNSEEVRRRLPILGYVKVGKKVQGEKSEYPTSLDHFLVEGKYAAKFYEVYEQTPNRITITFESDNLADVCFERYELRQGPALIAWGNGIDWHEFDSKKSEYREIQMEIEEIQKKYPAAKLKPVLILRFIIPKIRGVTGVWQLRTSGAKSSIPQIRDTFDMVQSKAGTVIAIPFDLCVEKVKSQTPGETKLFPVLTLFPNLSDSHLEAVQDYISDGSKRVRGLLNEQKLASVVEIESADFEDITEPREAEEIPKISLPEPKNTESFPANPAAGVPPGAAPKRPFDPAYLSYYIGELARGKRGKPPAKLLEATINALDVLTINNEDRKTKILNYIFRTKNPDHLTLGECEAVIRWIKLTNVQGEIVPCAEAIKEAESIYEFFGDEENELDKALNKKK